VLNRGRLLFPVLFCFALVVASFAVDHASNAQNYPPQPPTATPVPGHTPPPHPTPTHPPHPTPKHTPKPKKNCAITGTGRGSNFHRTSTFKPGEAITVRGGAGCASAGQTVTTIYDPAGNSRVLGTSTASSNGSYGNFGVLPRHAANGQHVIQSRTSDARFSSTITIVSGNGRPAGFLGSTPGLIGIGIVAALLALMVILAPRRRPRLLGVSGDTTTVPGIDTSGFVPKLGGKAEAPTRGRSSRKRSPRS
jgi:hypothetical protein